MTRKVTLLHSFLTQRGLFARVAKQLGIDPSYVSRVANGTRQNERISQAIEADLKKIHNASRKAVQSSSKKSVSSVSKKSRRVTH